MIAGALLALMLGFGPPEGEEVPGLMGEESPVETEEDDEEDDDEDPDDEDPDAHAAPSFGLSAGVAPPRNVWPYRQLCDLDPHQRPACLIVSADLITGYRYQNLAGDGFSSFSLDRAELGTALVWRPIDQLEAGARVRLEALRSAGPDSLQGIDGNALVVRAWQAFGQVSSHLGPIDLGLRIGLIPERWIEQVEKGHDIRAMAPLGSEARALFDTADLGASLTVSGWRSLIELDLEFVNGEGRSQREQNAGKNTTAILTVRPLRRPHRAGPIELALHGVFRDGSIGPASARNHRFGGALSFRSPWAFGGAEYVHALGHRERGDVRADVTSAWVSARFAPWAGRHFDPNTRFSPWGGVYGRFEHARLDVSLDDAAIDTIGAGVFAELFPYRLRNAQRVRLYVGYEREIFGANAGALPGAPAAQSSHRVLVRLRALGLARAHLERRSTD